MHTYAVFRLIFAIPSSGFFDCLFGAFGQGGGPYLQVYYCPGIDSASNRIEYQEHFFGRKSGRCDRLTTYHLPVPLSRKVGTVAYERYYGLDLPG